tara:strand:+ start:561 stop:725 length:165 start_codon:yes stop_codon:yes gene_type:complete
MTTILSTPWRLITILEQVSDDIAIGGSGLGDLYDFSSPEKDQKLSIRPFSKPYN